MKPIQDRIIKDFREKYPTLFNGCDGREGYDALITDDIEQFLIQSIKLVQEETRKEILDYVEKHSNNLVPIIGNMRHNEATLRLQNIRLNFDMDKVGGNLNTSTPTKVHLHKINKLIELMEVNYCGGTTDIKIKQDFWRWTEEITKSVNIIIKELKRK